MKTLQELKESKSVSTSVSNPDLSLPQTQDSELGEDTAHGFEGEEEEVVLPKCDITFARPIGQADREAIPDHERSFIGARDRAGLGESDTSFGGYNPRGRGTRGHDEGPRDTNFDFRTFMNFLAENQARGQLARSFTPMPPRKQDCRWQV